MTTTVDALEITKFEQRVARAMDQNGSLFRDHVRQFTGPAAQISIPRAERVNAIRGKPRHTMLVPANTVTDRININVQTIHAPDFIEDLEEFFGNVDLVDMYSTQIAQAVNTEIDRVILDAASATTNDVTSLLPAANTLNAEGLLVFRGQLTRNRVPFDGNRIFAASTGGMNDLLAQNQNINLDTVAQQYYQMGYITNLTGFKVIESQELLDSNGVRDGVNGGVATTNRVNVAWHKEAIGLAISSDVKLSVTYSADFDRWVVLAKCAMGAAIIRPEGVCKATINN